MFNNKKIFLGAIFIGFLLTASLVMAAEPLQLKYNFPCLSFPGAPCQATSQEAASSPAAYIIRLYQFALMLAGMLAFGMIIFGAIQYMVSAGNTTLQDDARDRISQALWGVALLLGSYLILYTIDPGLVNLKDPHIEQIVLPTYNTASSTCPGLKWMIEKSVFGVSTCSDPAYYGGGENYSQECTACFGPNSRPGPNFVCCKLKAQCVGPKLRWMTGVPSSAGLICPPDSGYSIIEKSFCNDCLDKPANPSSNDVCCQDQSTSSLFNYSPPSIENQIVDASPDLLNLITCINQATPVQITSISDSNHADGLNNGLSSCNPSSCPVCPDPNNCPSPGCAHSCNSCHYGRGSGKSNAVDLIGPLSYSYLDEQAIRKAAKGCNISDAHIIPEGDHLHVSTMSCTGN